MDRFINKKFLPLILIAVFAMCFVILKNTRPSAQRSANGKTSHIEVEAVRVSGQDFPISINSYGRIQSIAETRLASRVSGNVERIYDSAREGGIFKKGDILIEIEKTDYFIELEAANAQLAEAQSRLASEKAQAVEARHDWRQSGREGEPPALAVREPQLKAAQAQLKSAEASVKRAQLNLARTDIRAPFDGKTTELLVNLGQFITANTPVSEVFSTEAAEVNLPVSPSDLRFLPNLDNRDTRPKVTLRSSLFDEAQWYGEIVRISGALNEQNRQLTAIARIADAFIPSEQKPHELTLGEYVTATIEGVPATNAIVIPISTIYQGTYVYVYHDKKLSRRNVSIAWSDSNFALIDSGLNDGEFLVTTPLGQLPSGTNATLVPANNNQNGQGTVTP